MTVSYALGLLGVAIAQVVPAQPPVAATTPVISAQGNPAQTVAAEQPVTLSPQPSGKTPPTPLPTGKNAPNTDAYGVTPKDVKATTTFAAPDATPGQPLPADAASVTTLESALNIAFQRNPNVLQAQERAVRTVAVVGQILALKKPQVTASGSYTRLANGSSSAVGGGGLSLSSITNPFQVGLTSTPPGSTPITLSGSGGTGSAGGSNSSTTGQTGAANTAPTTTAAASRAETTPTRQTTGTGGTGTTNPGGGSGTSGSSTSFGRSTDYNQTSARITVSQLVDLTGIVKVAEQVGNLEEALTRLELARVRQETALQVRTSYYSVLRAIAFVRVNEAAVADSTELLRVTTAQKNAGVASQFDVLRAQTQLDNNRQALISSRNQVNIAKNALANTLGLDPSTPVDPVAPAIPPLPDLNEDALLARAIAQRPEYLQADTNILKARANTRLAHRNLEPYINASLNGGYNPSSSFGNEKATASVGLTLTVPLYDGGATKSSIEASRADERGAAIQKDQFVRGIKAEVQQAVIAVRDADERSRVVDLTVAQATEALRLANVRFRAGVGTQLDVNDSQSALIQAENNQVNARYDYLGAVARLERAIGTPQ